MEFIKAEDPIAVLGTYNQLTFKTDESMPLLKNPATTEDVKINCDDLKVLGKGDFKSLLKWRTALRAQVIQEHDWQKCILTFPILF
jgi:AdoMet-dependent rRNA methyltransferase SPB1